MVPRSNSDRPDGPVSLIDEQLADQLLGKASPGFTCYRTLVYSGADSILKRGSTQTVPNPAARYGWATARFGIMCVWTPTGSIS